MLPADPETTGLGSGCTGGLLLLRREDAWLVLVFAVVVVVVWFVAGVVFAVWVLAGVVCCLWVGAASCLARLELGCWLTGG